MLLGRCPPNASFRQEPPSQGENTKEVVKAMRGNTMDHLLSKSQSKLTLPIFAANSVLLFSSEAIITRYPLFVKLFLERYRNLL